MLPPSLGPSPTTMVPYWLTQLYLLLQNGVNHSLPFENQMAAMSWRCAMVQVITARVYVCVLVFLIRSKMVINWLMIDRA